MKKLYKVLVTIDVYVMAEDLDEARYLAREGAKNELYNGYLNVYKELKLIEHADEVPTDWLTSIPYRSEDGKTIRGFLKDSK